MTEKDVVDMLLERVAGTDGGAAQLARDWGFSKSFIGKVMGGHMAPSEKLCQKLGVRKTVTVGYERTVRRGGVN